MDTAVASDVDFVEELRLRTWARQNYVPGEERDPDWHPVILNEMREMDSDAEQS